MRLNQTDRPLGIKIGRVYSVLVSNRLTVFSQVQELTSICVTPRVLVMAIVAAKRS